MDISYLFLPLKMWQELLRHNFEKPFITLVNEETSIIYFIYLITSYEMKLSINWYVSIFFLIPF